MAKNSPEGNKARAARYRAGLAARGLRPVQLYVPESAHALLKHAVGLMIREQDPLEPRQALRQASGANDPGEGSDAWNEKEQALTVVVEAVRAELEAAHAEIETVREAGRQAEVAASIRAKVAERTREEATRALQAAEAAAAQAQAEAERFQKAPGLRGWAIRWLSGPSQKNI